jgi:CD63 antigen
MTYFMVFFNSLFSISGCILIGFGAWSQIAAVDYVNFLGENYVSTPAFLMVVGGMISVVAILGCCGPCLGNRCFIFTYAAILAVILVAQIGAGITAYVLREDLNDEVSNVMKNSMTNYEKNETIQNSMTNDENNRYGDYGGVTTTWDIIQKELGCCGVDGPTDWSIIFKEGQVPNSCKNDTAGLYDQGCYQLIKSKLVSNIALSVSMAVGVVMVQIVILLFTCFLASWRDD